MRAIKGANGKEAAKSWNHNLATNKEIILYQRTCNQSNQNLIVPDTKSLNKNMAK